MEVFIEGVEVSIGGEEVQGVVVTLEKQQLKKGSFFSINMNLRLFLLIDEGKEANGRERVFWEA
jgi:hypothetical protein